MPRRGPCGNKWEKGLLAVSLEDELLLTGPLGNVPPLPQYAETGMLPTAVLGCSDPFLLPPGH